MFPDFDIAHHLRISPLEVGTRVCVCDEHHKLHRKWGKLAEILKGHNTPVMYVVDFKASATVEAGYTSLFGLDEDQYPRLPKATIELANTTKELIDGKRVLKVPGQLMFFREQLEIDGGS